MKFNYNISQTIVSIGYVFKYEVVALFADNGSITLCEIISPELPFLGFSMFQLIRVLILDQCQLKYLLLYMYSQEIGSGALDTIPSTYTLICNPYINIVHKWYFTRASTVEMSQTNKQNCLATKNILL